MGGQPTRQGRAQCAGQHVAGAGRGQACIARGVDVRQPAGAGDHGARPLEQHGAVVALGELPCGRQAVLLHRAAVAGQQARCLQRVRREDGGPAALRAMAQLGLQLGVAGQGIERIGVEHQPRGAGQHARQLRAHGIPAATTTHDGAGAHVDVSAGTQHQLRPAGQGGGRHRRIQCGQVHTPGAIVQGGTGGQQCGTRHARRAPHDGHVAVAAFVRGMQSWPPARAAPIGGNRRSSPGKRGVLKAHLQVVEPDPACRVPSHRREQARLEREQAQRVLRLHMDLRGLSGVGIQAGGHVDGQDPCTAAGHMGDPVGHRAGRRPTGTDAQQGVDAEVGGRRWCGGERHPRVAGAAPCGGSIAAGRGGIAQPGHHRRLAHALQLGGGFEPVAAVVSGARCDPDGTGMGSDRQSQPGDGEAGPLHQGVGRHAGQREAFDPARGRHVEQRPAQAQVDRMGACGHGRGARRHQNSKVSPSRARRMSRVPGGTGSAASACAKTASRASSLRVGSWCVQNSTRAPARRA